MEPPRCTALERAMRILSVSAKSSRELKARLLQCGYGPTEADGAVEECIKRGYANDELLASDVAGCIMDRGSGCRKIRQKLLRRGLDKDLVAQTMEEIRDREPESARIALEFKWRMLSREKDPYKKKAKAFRFLVGRGYPAGLAAELVNEISSQEEISEI